MRRLFTNRPKRTRSWRRRKGSYHRPYKRVIIKSETEIYAL
jgi:hypothetical protein